jgi:hypothetical protein
MCASVFVSLGMCVFVCVYVCVCVCVCMCVCVCVCCVHLPTHALKAHGPGGEVKDASLALATAEAFGQA